MQILLQTAKRHQQPQAERHQQIEVPASLRSVRGGSFSLITRTVQVQGTVQALDGQPEPKTNEYGIASWAGYDVMCLRPEGGDRWKAIDIRAKKVGE